MSYAVQGRSKKEFQELLKYGKCLDYRQGGCGRTRMLAPDGARKKECDDWISALLWANFRRHNIRHRVWRSIDASSCHANLNRTLQRGNNPRSFEIL